MERLLINLLLSSLSLGPGKMISVFHHSAKETFEKEKPHGGPWKAEHLCCLRRPWEGSWGAIAAAPGWSHRAHPQSGSHRNTGVLGNSVSLGFRFFSLKNWHVVLLNLRASFLLDLLKVFVAQGQRSEDC